MLSRNDKVSQDTHLKIYIAQDIHLKIYISPASFAEVWVVDCEIRLGALGSQRQLEQQRLYVLIAAKQSKATQRKATQRKATQRNATQSNQPHWNSNGSMC
eukprot:SAG31_NODE_4201_length_3479_cov_1.626331_4_plen_101_part_00